MNTFTRLHTLRTSFVNVVLGYSGYLGYFCKKYKVHCFLYYKEKTVFHLHVLVNLIYTVLNKQHLLVTQPNHAAHPYIEHRTLIQSSGPLFHFHLRYFNHRFIHKWTNTFSENFTPAMISHSMRDKSSISNKDRPYLWTLFTLFTFNGGGSKICDTRKLPLRDQSAQIYTVEQWPRWTLLLYWERNV